MPQNANFAGVLPGLRDKVQPLAAAAGLSI
jgi:hypothetical protein